MQIKWSMQHVPINSNTADSRHKCSISLLILFYISKMTFMFFFLKLQLGKQESLANANVKRATAVRV